MSKKGLYLAWGGLFFLCAGLGFVPEAAGVLDGIRKVLALLFFVPPGLLVWQGKKTGDGDGLTLVRRLSAASLGATTVLVLVNFLTAMAGDFWGTAAHYALVVVSVPMMALDNWAGSLFCWACLLMAAGKTKQKKEG